MKEHFRDFSELKLTELSKHSKYIEYDLTQTESDSIIKFLKLAKERDEYLGYGDYYVKKGLLALENYLKADGYIFHTDVDSLLKELKSEKYNNYENYTIKIIELLKLK